MKVIDLSHIPSTTEERLRAKKGTTPPPRPPRKETKK
jgi:hypothetical protein